jgi:hypothetical protein
MKGKEQRIPTLFHYLAITAYHSTSVQSLGYHSAEIPIIIDPSATKKSPSATGTITVGIAVHLSTVLAIIVHLCQPMPGQTDAESPRSRSRGIYVSSGVRMSVRYTGVPLDSYSLIDTEE